MREVSEQFCFLLPQKQHKAVGTNISWYFLYLPFDSLNCFIEAYELWLYVRYLKERKQFGAPLAAFQINQQKLVRMLGNVQAMFLVGWRLCKLYESGKMTPGHASMGKVIYFTCG